MKNIRPTTAALSLAGAVLLGRASWEENHHLSETHITLKVSGLPEAFEGLRLLHLSDLHNSRFGPGQRKLLERAAAARPDAVCLTGDLIDKRRTRSLEEAGPALELCWGLTALAPVFFVPGNHEAIFPDYPKLRRILREMGVIFLEDRRVLWKRNGCQIALAGLRDPGFFQENKLRFRQNLYRVTKGCDTFTVLLSHRPEEFTEYCAAGVQVVLAGHAHGGQMRLPGVGPVWVPSQGFFPEYAQGVHQLGRTSMAVSRGLGNSLFPQRILNRPEIVVETLLCGSAVR